MKRGEHSGLDEPLQQLALDVVAGFDEAAKCYPELSGGWELHMAPEYYCTVKVAEQLSDREHTYVSLEQNIAHALALSGRQTDAEPTDELPDFGRFDIAVWGPGTEGIVGIVEIKEVTFVTYANLERDVKRVLSTLDQTKIRWGMVAWYASLWDGDAKTRESKSGKERLETRTEIIETKARDAAQEVECVVGRLKCAHVAGCLRPLKDEYHQGGVGQANVLLFHKTAF